MSESPRKRIDMKSKSPSPSPLQQTELEASPYRTANSISSPRSNNRGMDDGNIRRRSQYESSSTSASRSLATDTIISTKDDNECKENRPVSFKSPIKFGGSSSPDVSLLKTRKKKTNRRDSSSSDTTVVFSSPSGQSYRHIGEDKENDDDSGSVKDDFVQIMSRHRSGKNEIHGLCGCMNTVGELMRAQSYLFGTSPDQASNRDFKGETVLHAFSNNKALAAVIGNPNNEDYETKDFLTLFSQPSIDKDSSDQLNKLVEIFLVDDLLPSFLGAPMVENNDGQIPFEAGLIDWIETSQKEIHDPHDDTGYFSAYTHKVSDAVTHAWESTSTTFLGAIALRGKSAAKVSEYQRQGIPHNNDIENRDTLSTGSVTSSSQSLGRSKMTPHARFCLRMLSLILDELEKRNVGMGRQMIQDVSNPSDLCASIVEKVASIPHLLEVIFSINDDNDLEFALSTKIIQRVLVDKHSVGPWLTTMLQSPQRQISQRAIDYLQIVSKLCAGKQKRGQKGFKQKEETNNSEAPNYNDLIDEVSRLNDFIPSLLALGDRVIEEVSTTLIVKKVLDKMIARPFVATVVLMDAIMLILMILGFRAAVNGMIMGDDLDTVLKWIYVVSRLLTHQCIVIIMFFLKS
ncbi:MAG: hypothetical protein ACI8RD_005123 [Bacillariaceae sp.]|jgi:hypothetical protein